MINQGFKVQGRKYEVLPNSGNLLQGARRLFAHACAVSALPINSRLVFSITYAALDLSNWTVELVTLRASDD